MAEEKRDKRKEKDNRLLASVTDEAQKIFESRFFDAGDPRVLCAIDGTKCTGPCKQKAIVGNIIKCSEAYKVRPKRF